MYVPSHQMHHVLNHFCKQLSRQTIANRRTSDALKPSADDIKVSPDRKRQAAMEKVSNEIFNKITGGGSAKGDHRQFNHRPDEIPQDLDGTEKQVHNEFVFNVIDHVNQKQTNSLPVEDSNFLTKRIEKLAQEAVHKKMDSWV